VVHWRDEMDAQTRRRRAGLDVPAGSHRIEMAQSVEVGRSAQEVVLMSRLKLTSDQDRRIITRKSILTTHGRKERAHNHPRGILSTAGGDVASGGGRAEWRRWDIRKWCVKIFHQQSALVGGPTLKARGA
jgi:hypothetical protein